MRRVYVRKTLRSQPFRNMPDDDMFTISSDEFERGNFLKPNPIDALPTDTETFKALDVEKHGLRVQLGDKTIRSIVGKEADTTLNSIKKDLEAAIISGATLGTTERNKIIAELAVLLGKQDLNTQQLEKIKLIALQVGGVINYAEMGLPRIIAAPEFKSMAGVVLLVLLMNRREESPEAINYPVNVFDNNGDETKQRVRASQIYNNLTASGRGLEKYLDMELGGIVPRNIALLTLDDNKEINKGGFLNGVARPVGGWLSYNDDIRMPPWKRVQDGIPPLPPDERFKVDRDTKLRLQAAERKAEEERKRKQAEDELKKKQAEDDLKQERNTNAGLLALDNTISRLSDRLDKGDIDGREYVRQMLNTFILINDILTNMEKYIYETTYRTLLDTLINLKNTTPQINTERKGLIKLLQQKIATFKVAQVPVVQVPTSVSVPTQTTPPATTAPPLEEEKKIP